MTSTPRRAALSRLLNANHIAVFGASAAREKWGHGVVAGMLKSGYDGKLTLVNPRGGEVFGLPLVGAESAAGADLAVIATPAPTTPDILRECSALEIPVAAVVAGGFRESGNARLQQELQTISAETGIRLLGPNCLGIVVGARGINTTSFDLPLGTVSAIAQSGGFVQHAGIRLAQLGAGFDVVVSLGNKVDVNFSDALTLVAEAGTSTSLVLYLERADEGDAFFDVVANVAANLPTAAIVAGKTAAGRRATRSHTDSLISNWDRVTGLLQDVGVQVVSSIPAAVAAAVGGQRIPRRPLSRVFVLCDGGSGSVLLGDALEDAGYTLPQPSRELAEELRQVVGLHALPPNPLDMQGRAEVELESLLTASRLALESEQYDALVVGGIFGSYGRLLGNRFRTIEERIASELPRLAAELGRPVVVQSMYASESSHALDLLRRAGVPCVEWPEEAVSSLNAATTELPVRKRVANMDLPPSSASSADPNLTTLSEGVIAALEAAGIPHALGHLVVPGTPATWGQGPWVVRADGFPHKVASGAIQVGVATSDVPDVVNELGRVSQAAGLTPAIRVGPYVEHDHELIVTFWRDPLEGSGCMLGKGGSSVEESGDIAIGRIPVRAADARTLLSRTSIGTRLLDGDQDGERLIAVLVALGEVFRNTLPHLRELECNPIAVTNDGTAIVLDVLPSAAGAAVRLATAEAPRAHPQ